jgi:hypothetical protein
MKKCSFVALLLVGATVLGATVLREPIAHAAQTTATTIVGPLDANGNVKVHDQGTSDVNVTNSTVPVHEEGTSSVAVTNGPATQPVQVSDGFQLTGSSGLKLSYTVPDGKRLVLEYAAADARGPNGDKLFIDFIDGGDPNGPTIVFLPLEFQGDFFGEDRYTASEPVRAYVEGGHQVAVEVDQTSEPDLATFRWTLSGYLIDT